MKVDREEARVLAVLAEDTWTLQKDIIARARMAPQTVIYRLWSLQQQGD